MWHNDWDPFAVGAGIGGVLYPHGDGTRGLFQIRRRSRPRYSANPVVAGYVVGRGVLGSGLVLLDAGAGTGTAVNRVSFDGIELRSDGLCWRDILF